MSENRYVRDKVGHFFFNASNYYKAVRSVTRPHRLVLPSSSPVFKEAFVLTEDKKAEWQRVFETEEEQAVPFTYFLPASVKIFHDFLDRVQVNFRHVLHLRSDILFFNPGSCAMQSGVGYQVQVILDHVKELPKKRVVLCFRTEVSQAGGQVACELRDFFMVKALSIGSLAGLKESPLYAGKTVFTSHGAASRAGSAFQPDGEYQNRRVFFPEDLGRRYGAVSGDMNIVHINKFVVRLFGYEKIFAQGLCTANYMIKYLSEMAPVRSMSISFCKPVFLGQHVTFKMDARSFEVADSQDTILAFGGWKAFEGASRSALETTETLMATA